MTSMAITFRVLTLRLVERLQITDRQNFKIGIFQSRSIHDSTHKKLLWPLLLSIMATGGTKSYCPHTTGNRTKKKNKAKTRVLLALSQYVNLSKTNLIPFPNGDKCVRVQEED
ncbi:unnamed protein product [Amoebophrya sp. A120]|nr:unnamed protein product [Amoebophrya sp. A120]|eukprot:GSA120T00017549001.1